MSLYSQKNVRTTARDAEIFSDFYFATEHLPREEAASIAGVSVPTLRRWEQRATHRFQRGARLRILRYLARLALEKGSP